MKFASTSFACALLAMAAFAQTVPVNSLPGSQANGPNATLTASGTVNPPLGSPIPFTALGTGTPSASASVLQLMAGIFVPTGPSVSLTVDLQGLPLGPFALVAATEPSSLFCSFPSTSCGNPGWLPGSTSTPSGIYHLGPNPIVLLDGIGLGLNPAPAGQLNFTGAFSLQAIVPWSNTNALFAPDNHAVQALFADPSAPTGFSLSAAFGLPKWQVACPTCAQ